MAHRQSRTGTMNRSWIRPGYELPKRKPFHQEETDDPTPQESYHPSRPSGSSSIPLLNRIQMDQEESAGLALGLGSQDTTGQGEKSLIDRIEIAPDDDMNGRHSSRSTTSLWAPTQHRNDGPNRNGTDDFESNRNGKLIDNNKNVASGSDYFGVSHGQKHVGSRQNAWHYPETSAYKQLDSRDGLKDTPRHHRSRSYATSPERPSRSSLRDHHAVTLDRASSSHGASTHHKRQSLQVTAHPAPSVTSEAFVDHFLPLAQQIADVRRKDSKDGNSPDTAAQVNPSVITADVLDQFSQQLMRLGLDLQRVVPIIEKAQSAAAAKDSGGESRIPPASVNGHDHERAGATEPSGIRSKEIRIPPLRTPTPEYLEKKRRSLLVSPSSHKAPHDLHRRQSSVGKGMRGWDYHDYRHVSGSMSTSPHKERQPYASSSKKERRDFSPTRYHRRDSRESLAYQRRPRRSSRSRSPPLRRRRSFEKPKHDSVSLSRGHMSNHVKEPAAQETGLGSILLQDLLEKRSGIASPQQGTRKLSGLNVPGLWFVSRGLPDIGMSTFEFEVDEPMAVKWNIQSDEKDQTQATLEDTETLIDKPARLRLSLELSCFSFDDVQMMLQNLGRNVAFRDFGKALSKLEHDWPPQGHLIISVNAESQKGKLWFPGTFKGSIKLGEFIYKGINLIRFVQLSDLSGKIFVLLANGFEKDQTTMNFLLPDKGGESSFQKAIPTISKA